MDASTGAIFGAIGGAIAVGVFNLILEIFRRASDRRGIASAIAGEVSAIISVIEIRGLVKYFEDLTKELRLPNARPAPWFILDASVDATPVIKAYIGKIGSLGDDLPRRVVHFYTLYESVRTELRILCNEKDPVAGANRIDRTLPIWYLAKGEADALVKDLLEVSGQAPV